MKKKSIGIACIFVAVIMTASGCKAAAVDTENSVPVETSALASVMETTKEPTETAAATTAKATQKVTATPAPTVKETTAATTTKPSETKAPAVTTTAAPEATTKAPVATTAAPTATTAAPPVETAAPPAATTAAPAKDYSAMCAEIRSKLIAILETNGKWDPNFTGEAKGWGQKWWEVGYFEDYDMSTQDVADEYYNHKFSGTQIACRIECYVADGKIYLDYYAYQPA